MKLTFPISTILSISLIALIGCSDAPVTPTISAEQDFSVLAVVRTLGSAQDIWIEDDIAYVADNEHGVTTWRVDGAGLQFLENITYNGNAKHVMYSGATRSLIAGYEGIWNGAVAVYSEGNFDIPDAHFGFGKGSRCFDVFAIHEDTLSVCIVEEDFDGFRYSILYRDTSLFDDRAFWSDIGSGSYPPRDGQIYKDVAYSDGKAYIAQGEWGLQILQPGPSNGDHFDIDPLGVVDTPGDAVAVALDTTRNLAFLAARYAGVMIVNVGNPYIPYLIREFLPEGLENATGIAYDDGIIYLIDANRGLYAIELRNTTTQPKAIGFFESPAPSGLFIRSSDHTIYLADEQLGIVVLRLNDIPG